jgi:hypothetical protein
MFAPNGLASLFFLLWIYASHVEVVPEHSHQLLHPLRSDCAMNHDVHSLRLVYGLESDGLL